MSMHTGEHLVCNFPEPCIYFAHIFSSYHTRRHSQVLRSNHGAGQYTCRCFQTARFSRFTSTKCTYNYSKHNYIFVVSLSYILCNILLPLLVCIQVFLDEINTSSCLGYLKEIIVDKMVDGQVLDRLLK